MATKTKKTASKKATAPAVAEVVEDDDEELDEVEETEEATPTKTAAQEVTFGASDLAKHLSEGQDKPVSAREIRTLIRKMARDGKGRVNREIKQGNRTRYNWSGLNDPEVKAIIAAFNAGELEQDKQEKLAALKENKAKKDAAKKAEAETSGTPVKKATKKKAKPAPVEVEEDDEELELDDDE